MRKTLSQTRHDVPVAAVGGGERFRFSVLGLLKLTAIVAVVYAVAFVVVPPLWALANETPWAMRVLGGLVVFPLLFRLLVVTGVAFRMVTLLVAPVDVGRDKR